MATGIVQTAIYLEYSQTIWPPLCLRIGEILSSTTLEQTPDTKTTVSFDDTPEKMVPDVEKALPTTDHILKQTESADKMGI